MKTLVFFIAMLLATSLFAWNPDTTSYSVMGTKITHIVEDTTKIQLNIDEGLDQMNINENRGGDTVNIRIGKRSLDVITKDKNTHVNIEKIEDFESIWDENGESKLEDSDEISNESNSKESYDWNFERDFPKHKKRHKKFDGHWSGIEFGGNQLWNTQYPTALYPEGTPDFLATRPEKSFEFNINFAEYSFGFNSYIGIVTGLGFNFNDYKFKNPYTIIRDANGMIQPVALSTENLDKTKLSTAFFTAPLLLEIQIPGQNDRMFISGGVIGGVKLGQHTKTKINGEKSKNKNDLNINPIRWGYTARIGFEDMGIFGTYYNTKLFEDGKGPVTTPWTVGIVLTFD